MSMFYNNEISVFFLKKQEVFSFNLTITKGIYIISILTYFILVELKANNVCNTL